jgi:hypothetical protein
LEQRQDVRSLAAFRILAGVYLIYDIVSRLQHGRFSLLWYTSTEHSFLHPEDTPHRSPIHRMWFYRGSEFFQLTLFFITFLLAVSFTLGYKCNVVSKSLLWLNVVAMQCRCMPPHDGSDTYLRHLLLWSIQLPVSQVWSIDAIHQHDRRVDSYCTIDNRAAVWGLRLQIVLMYVGTVMHRTTDQFGWAIYKSRWLPPQLTAVFYSLSGSFATRECWLGNFVRATLPLSQFLTLSAMLLEGFAPIMCLFMGDNAYIPAFLLFKLHLGLLILINLPNWQLIGMAATVIWIPSCVWDKLQRSLSLKFPRSFSPPRVIASVTSLQKKDMVQDENASGTSRKKEKSIRRRRPFLTYFFLSYMLYDFSGNRGWVRKIDHGDIGEFLRFSQYWVMFSGPSTGSYQVMLTGTLNGEENVNVWEWLKNGNVEVVDVEAFQENIWANMTHVYPSPRVERMFSSEWPRKEKNDRSIYFLTSLCEVIPFTHLQITQQQLLILPPGSRKRYSKVRDDKIIEVGC